MKSRVFIGFMALVLLISAGARAQGPVAVSPGSGSGEATITQECPTFSWSEAGEAVAYRLEVFEMITSGVPAHSEISTLASSVIREEIRAPALSWTPSAESV
ncbi:MAG: hypothetical protein AB1638_04555 [Nitrospirota bacterium]